MATTGMLTANNLDLTKQTIGGASSLLDMKATAGATQPPATAAPGTTPPAPPASPDITPREVKPNETVAGQLNSLLGQNSAYMQSAKANALSTANERGLLNSSMAVGAGQKAAIDSAMPIAQQDAATFSQSALSAQQAKETYGLNKQNIQGNLDLQKQSQDAAYTLQTKLKQMDVDIDTKRLDAQQVNALSAAIGPIQQQYIQNITQIQSLPDSQLDAIGKQVAIRNLQQQMQTQMASMASLYKIPITWNPPGATPVPPAPPQPGPLPSPAPTPGDGNGPDRNGG